MASGPIPILHKCRRPRIPSPSFAQPFRGSEPVRSGLLRLKPERVCYLNCEESCNVTEADTPQASGLLACPEEVSSCEVVRSPCERGFAPVRGGFHGSGKVRASGGCLGTERR